MFNCFTETESTSGVITLNVDKFLIPAFWLASFTGLKEHWNIGGIESKLVKLYINSSTHKFFSQQKKAFETEKYGKVFVFISTPCLISFRLLCYCPLLAYFFDTLKTIPLI